MSTLKVTNIQHPSAESPAIELDATDGVVFSAASFDAAAITSGVLDAARVPLPPEVAGIGSNVVQAVKSDTQASSLGNGEVTAITGLTCTITPSATTSKVLVLAHVTAAASTSTIGHGYGVILKRDGNAIGVGDEAGSRRRITTGAAHAGDTGYQSIAITFLDNPETTSPVDYTLDIQNNIFASKVLYVNRSNNDPDRIQDAGRAITTLTAIEVAG